MALTPPDSRRLLLLCVVTAALLGTALSGQPFPVCGVKCCTVLPSCSAALRVMCNCTGQDSMTLQKGDIPKSVLAIHIWNAGKIVIDKDAVNDLKHLTNFSLRGIDQVEIRENGMAFDKQSKIRSVKFQDIRRLRIKSKAFSGVWETRTSISISRTTELYMESNAFEYRSTSLGPSLALQHVRMLKLDSNGFMAPLYYLSLDDVTMNVCHGKSFGGKIHSIVFNKVTIAEAKARCFSNLGSLSTFSIQSSSMKTVHPQAFSGNIRELIIKNSNFTSMHERSIDIRTVRMQIASSQIKHLSANGLYVLAKDSIRLEHIRVDFLRKNALAGLQIQRSSDGFTQPLVIRKLDILNAENGSLAFSDCTEIQMSNLDIVAPWPRVCPTEQWVRQLVGAAASGQLKRAQFEVFMELFGRHLCTEDIRTSFPTMTSGQSPLCAMRPSSTPDYVDSDDYYEYSRDTLPDDGWGDEETDTPRRNDRADSSHEVSHKQPSGVDGVRRATSASTASTASSPGSTTESAASGVTDQPKPPGEVDGGRPGGAGQSAVGYVADEQGEKTGTSNSGDVKTDSSHGSETPPGSIRKSAPTESRGEAEPHPAEPVPSRRPAAGDGLDAAPAGAPGSVPEDRLLLYVSMGAVLSLAAVLVVVVLLLARRRSRDRQPADEQPPAMNKLQAPTLTNWQPTPGGDKRPLTTSGGWPLGSACPSVDYHQYEPVREDMLMPPPADYHQYELVREDLLRPPPVDYHQYDEPAREDMLLPLAPPPTQYEGSCGRSQTYAKLLDR